jgi:hypothetical protein
MSDVSARHCDEYIDDPTAPVVLRKFLAWARSPAHGALVPGPHPRLFADHADRRVRVVMASRFGDVGISSDLGRETGYETRVPIEALTNFGDAP